MSDYKNHPGFDAGDCEHRITVSSIGSSANGYACSQNGGHCLPNEKCGEVVGNKVSYDMKVDELEHAEELLRNARDVLQEVYSMRGEDPLIQKLCSPMIDKLASY